MTEPLEVRTPYTDVAQVVRELAAGVDDLSIRLPSLRPVPDGEWVRFTVLLADGSSVFEGIGRSQGSRVEGTRYCVRLALLQLDERNEVMYERMLLARDAAEETGTIDLEELGAELVRAPSRSAPPPPPRKTSPPPSIKPPAPARAPSVTPPRPPPPRASSPPPRASSLPPPPAPKASAALRPARPASSARPAPKSAPARPEPFAGGAADAATAAAERPPKRRRPVEASAPSDTLAARRGAPLEREGTLRLEVGPHLVARARALAPTLPEGLIGARAPAEEAVLRAALRIGLAALAGVGGDE